MDLNLFGNYLFNNVSTEIKKNKKRIYFLSHLLKEVPAHLYTECLLNGSLNPGCISKAFYDSKNNNSSEENNVPKGLLL